MTLTGRRVAAILWLLLIPPWCLAKTSELQIHTSKAVHSFNVTTAISQSDRSIGLHGWTSLAADEGMLFVFPELTQRPFWMKHISIPLDILFIDSSGRIVDMVEHAEPGSEALLVANSPFLATLEVIADTVVRMGINRGDHVRHCLIQDSTLQSLDDRVRDVNELN